VLLCRTVGGPHIYSTYSSGYDLRSMKTIGFLSLIWPIFPPWSPSIGLLEKVSALRPHVCGNAGPRPEDVPLLKEGGIVTVR
jgi:hypothetical protein